MDERGTEYEKGLEGRALAGVLSMVIDTWVVWDGLTLGDWEESSCREVRGQACYC